MKNVYSIQSIFMDMKRMIIIANKIIAIISILSILFIISFDYLICKIFD